MSFDGQPVCVDPGNKADLIDTLLRTRDNFNKGDDNEPATTSDAQAPWEEEAKPLSAEAKAQKVRAEIRCPKLLQPQEQPFLSKRHVFSITPPYRRGGVESPCFSPPCR